MSTSVYLRYRSRLLHKYQTLLELRRSREALEARGVLRLTGEEGRARQAVVRALAEEFPACLRELEDLSSAAIEQRLRDVERLAEYGEAPLWLRLVIELHADLRQARTIKHWLRRHPADQFENDAARLRAFSTWFATHPEAGSFAPPLGAGDLAQLERPTHGRLLAHILRLIAERHGLLPEQVADVVFRGAGCEGEAGTP